MSLPAVAPVDKAALEQAAPSVQFNGGRGEIRTLDFRRVRTALSPLSYPPTWNYKDLLAFPEVALIIKPLSEACKLPQNRFEWRIYTTVPPEGQLACFSAVSPKMSVSFFQTVSKSQFTLENE